MTPSVGPTRRLDSSIPAGLEASWLAGWLACWPAGLGSLRRIGDLLEGDDRLEKIGWLGKLARIAGIGGKWMEDVG